MVKTLDEIHSEIKKFSPHPERVRILAISKKQSVDKIIKLYSAGQTSFGENYAQEALEKISQIQLPIQWHFVGHLQSNKVKDVVGKFKLIHSVDTIKLAEAINRRASDLNILQNILLEINIGNETTKSGFPPEELLAQWSKLQVLNNISIHGLMCLPPVDVTQTETEKFFERTENLRQQLKDLNTNSIHPLLELSMGTSGDYIIALKKKSTLLRLGTILFGERT